MAAVGVVGLGGMGKNLAARLADFLSAGKAPGFAGPLWAYNRSADKTDELVAAAAPGTVIAGSLDQLAERCRVVFFVLANDAATESIMAQFVASRRDGAAASPVVAVNVATILPSTVTRLAAAVAEADGAVTLVNMPVFGRPDAVAAGTLVAVPAGPRDAMDVLAPLLPAFATKVWADLGEDPARSAALKLIGNFFIVSSIELASECLTLAAKTGVDDSTMLRMLEHLHKSPIPTGYATRMSAGDYAAGFSTDNALKDVGHMRQLAADAACPLPLADTAFGHLLAAKAKHGPSLDWGAIHLAVRDAAGLPPNIKDKPE